MKHFFFTLCMAILATIQGFSQAYSLKVVNYTDCTVYYKIVGDELCKCGESYGSDLFALPPMGVADHSTSMTLGGGFPSTTPKSLVAAYVMGNPFCSGSDAGVVGEDACGYPYVYYYKGLKTDCSPCAKIVVKWVPASDCKAYAQLIFSY